MIQKSSIILHGRDDFGIQKSGFLWKHSRNSLKPWKQYYFVLTRLCLICYHRGSNGIQGKNPKHKIDLSSISDIELGGSKSRRKHSLKQFRVFYGNKGGQQLLLKSDEETVTKEWVQLMKDSTLLCSTREKVHSELRRASFKRNVEQNVRDKFSTHRANVKSEDLPTITYLNRTPWDERIRSVDINQGDFKGQGILMSPMPLSPEKRCYTYSENIVLSTPDISVSQINEESRKNSFILGDNVSDTHQSKGKQHLSKSFSSDDVRITTKGNSSHEQTYIGKFEQHSQRTSKLSNFQSQRHAQELNEDNLDDGDSGQGSEEFNNYADSFDDTIHVGGVMLDNSQSSNSSRFQRSRSSRLQWVEDDSLNFSNESEICFHGDLCNWRSDEQLLCQNAMPPVVPSLFSSTVSRSSRRWSSELDLVPEEQELGLFRPRNSRSNFVKANTLQSYPNYVYKEVGNSRDSFQARGSNRFQHTTQDRDRKSVSTLPRYGVPNDVSYQSVHTHRSETPDDSHDNKGKTYTYYKGDTTFLGSSNNGQRVSTNNDIERGKFERQNKFYHSLDSSVSRYKSVMTPGNREGIYLGHNNQKHNYYHVSNHDYRNQLRDNSYGIGKNKTTSNPVTRTTKDFSYSDHRKTIYYHGNSHRSTNTYHGYEETETNFSGADDSESELIVNPLQGRNRTGDCRGVSRLYKIGKEALPSGCVEDAVYYV